MVRCILESLAARYASVLAQTELLSERKFYELHMVGGGMQNELLCELTAKAIGRPVLAGPAEATAAGNIGIQMIAHGWFRDMYGLRSCINQSFNLKEYEA